jgi:hypothetical protein
MSEETKENRRERQAQENWAMIGRYIQHFELMVDAARSGCLMIMCGDLHHQRLVNIALNHQSMTARPLFDILRSLVYEMLGPSENASEEAQAKAKSDRGRANEIFTQLDTDYQAAVKFRNDLVHSTWRIGWGGSETEDFSEMLVYKFKATAKGLRVSHVAKTKGDIEPEIQRCDGVRSLLLVVWRVCLLNKAFPDSTEIPDIQKAFIKHNGRWIISTQS